MTPRADIPEITTGIVAALAAHAILVGIILFANFGPEEAHALVLPVLETELLMLGEQMPEEGMLPRMANPEERRRTASGRSLRRCRRRRRRRIGDGGARAGAEPEPEARSVGTAPTRRPVVERKLPAAELRRDQPQLAYER